MNNLKTIWHYKGESSRAFVRPKGFCNKVYLYLRGYRLFNYSSFGIYSKPSKKLGKHTGER
jgi:hypothetical protein